VNHGVMCYVSAVQDAVMDANPTGLDPQEGWPYFINNRSPCDDDTEDDDSTTHPLAPPHKIRKTAASFPTTMAELRKECEASPYESEVDDGTYICE